LTTETGLIKYDAMIHAIAVCYDIDEIKDIRDRALAFEKYAQVAMNTDAEHQCADIRVRAERKAGALLADMEKAKGAREPGTNRGTTRSRNDTASTLDALGISKGQSSRWQRLAAISDDQFESAISGSDKPSTTGVLRKSGDSETAMDSDALWLWGRLRDFERRDIFSRDVAELIELMTDTMAADARRLAPAVRDFLRAINGDSNGK